MRLSTDQTILEVRDLSFRHRLSRTRYSGNILSRVNLKVNEGEILVLLGPSGAGKTSFLRLLNRLEDPQEGDIFFRGQNIRERKAQDLRRAISLVAQEPYLVEGTVRDNLQLPLNGLGDSPDVREQIAGVLRSVNLSEDILSRSVQHLSLGEKQRICIARTLMLSPELILLDEPTSALDIQNREILAHTIRRINRAGAITFIIVTHLQTFAESLSGRLLKMRQGEIVPWS